MIHKATNAMIVIEGKTFPLNGEWNIEKNMASFTGHLALPMTVISSDIDITDEQLKELLDLFSQEEELNEQPS